MTAFSDSDQSKRAREHVRMNPKPLVTLTCLTCNRVIHTEAMTPTGPGRYEAPSPEYFDQYAVAHRSEPGNSDHRVELAVGEQSDG